MLFPSVKMNDTEADVCSRHNDGDEDEEDFVQIFIKKTQWTCHGPRYTRTGPATTMTMAAIEDDVVGGNAELHKT